MSVVATADGAPILSGREFVLSAGGAESNVAAHLAGRGRWAIWLSRLGVDPLGDRIMRELTGRGVDASAVLRDSGRPTGMYVKERVVGGTTRVFYYRAGSAASAMSPEDLATWAVPDGAHIHVSGITPALSASCSQLIDAVLDGPYRTSFDVNYRPALWPVEEASERLRELADRADTVFVGLDEAHTLWGTTTADDVAALLDGPARLVVKDGSHEAVEFARVGERRVVTREAAFEVDVVEPVGAGDAFAAGYLDGLLSAASAEERLLLGHELASWNLGSVHDVRPRR